MVKETMTSEERILAAINLEPYDRVPVAPLISPAFPLRHKGRHTADAYSRDLRAEGFQAVLDLFDEVGGWDGVVTSLAMPALPPDSSLYHFYRTYSRTMRLPGRDERLSVDSSPQFAEHEILKAEDYDEIIKLGWRDFMEKNAERIAGSPAPPLEVRVERGKIQTDLYIRERDTWHKRGVTVISGFVGMDPQMALSLMRTLLQFTLDLHRRPDKVTAVLDAWVDDFATGMFEAMRPTGISPTGIPGINLPCERGSGFYYNLKIFERFVWPYIKKLVETWYAEGYITTLHFDTDWTLNLPYLLELPKKSCICELDSTTDIFKAKEILKDHICIMGDVPPQLSAYGTPEEMEAYCKKLIDIVGKDTGFILSSGCEVPPDTKFENFKMMIDTAKNYYPHGEK